jgi:Flp pilus assembly protein TadG
MRQGLLHLVKNGEGMMAVETAIVATVVALLSLGSFQVSSFIARQNEMQGAAADAEAIVLAASPSTTAQLSTIKSIISTSTGINADNIQVTFAYRCGATGTLLTNSNSCNGNGANHLWTFVRVQISQIYTPLWASYGLGSAISLGVDRTVQVS